MAKIFSIKVPRTDVTLDPTGKGVVAFSVTNTGTGPQRGQAVVRPDKPGIDAWFSVADAVRDYPVGVSTEVKVQLAVPPEAPPGAYQFALDLVREGPEPLEERTDQGPGVSFGVKGGRPRWLLWAIIGGAVALVAIIVLVIVLSNQKVAVPDISGNDLSQASTALAKAGLVPGSISTASSDSVAQGLALGSTPGAKTSIPPKSTVDLVFSGGKPPVMVPDVRGMTKAQAMQALTSLGLVLKSTPDTFDASIPTGNVVASTPSAGSSIPAGSPVDLVISKGTPAPVSNTLQRVPAEDTFAYPTTIKCLTIIPWIIEPKPIEIITVAPISYRPEAPAAPQATIVSPILRATLLVPVLKLTLIAPFLTLEPPPLFLCPDAKSPELTLRNDLYKSTFYPGLVMLRFEFPEISDTATLTAASLRVNAASLGSGTSDMTLTVSAATNEWKVGGTSPLCSAEHSAPVKMTGPGQFTFDLKPLLAVQGQNILHNGLCLQSDSLGLVNLVSSEGGVATQRPLLSVTYNK